MRQVYTHSRETESYGGSSSTKETTGSGRISSFLYHEISPVIGGIGLGIGIRDLNLSLDFALELKKPRVCMKIKFSGLQDLTTFYKN